MSDSPESLLWGEEKQKAAVPADAAICSIGNISAFTDALSVAILFTIERGYGLKFSWEDGS